MNDQHNSKVVKDTEIVLRNRAEAVYLVVRGDRLLR